MHAIAVNGLRISDCDGRDALLSPDDLKVTTDPATALAPADIVVVAVKSTGTRAMATLVERHARSGTTVVSFQNGTINAQVLEDVLGTGARVVAGMVPFNVVQTRDPGDVPHMHRATSGRVHIAAGHPGLAAQLNVPGAPVVVHRDMLAIAWGKLVLNLNNALNALSGLPLQRQLGDRRWRLILAAQVDEALAAMHAAGIRPARIDGVEPRLMPLGLRLPNLLFRVAARSMLAVDPQARSSMWEDLQRRRPTEIDHLQGTIIALAATSQTPVPMVVRVRELIRAAEAAGAGPPGLSPADVAGQIMALT